MLLLQFTTDSLHILNCMLVQTLKHLGPLEQQKETFSAAAKTQKNLGLFVRQNFTCQCIISVED